MTKSARKAELKVLGPLYLQAKCQEAGLDASGSKAELIDRLLESEGQVSEPAGEPTEPVEPMEPPEEQPNNQRLSQ